MQHTEHDVADRLNRECFCIGTDLDALHSTLQADLDARGLSRPVIQSHPHLFSTLPVFVAREHVLQMQQAISAIEALVVTSHYAESVLRDAPAVARPPQHARGVLLGYDFHLTVDGPKLIEINTNAGGAMLNTVLGRAQRACCEEVAQLMSGPSDFAALETHLVDMFKFEWRRAHATRPLQRIAIVDSKPADQYLYPEFALFAQLFEAHGIAAVISDPDELHLHDNALWHGGERIDLIYNRVTDFYFEDPAHAVLRRAYEAGAVMITPHPHAHALYANKHNLALLTDAALLRRWGVADSTVATLTECVPATQRVTAAQAEQLWTARKSLFFKPAQGYGSRGAYRGDKLTRRVFAEILQSDYVAQAMVPPSERISTDAAHAPVLKVDLRNYVYNGQVLLIAARLYQGQTTNFRTPGGGFAPVFYPTTQGWCGPMVNGELHRR